MPLLRELAAMPIFGRLSKTKTSLQRDESARAIAHPTTPPPMITTFACSTDASLSGRWEASKQFSIGAFRRGALEPDVRYRMAKQIATRIKGRLAIPPADMLSGEKLLEAIASQRRFNAGWF